MLRRALSAFIGVALVSASVQLRAQTASEAARLFDALELDPGDTVAEIGAGRGRLTVEMAKRLGPTGRMYSSELNPERLAEIRDVVSRAAGECHGRRSGRAIDQSPGRML